MLEFAAYLHELEANPKWVFHGIVYNTTDLLPHPAGLYSRTHNIATKTPVNVPAPVLKISMELSFQATSRNCFPLLTCKFRGSGEIMSLASGTRSIEVEKEFHGNFRTTEC